MKSKVVQSMTRQVVYVKPDEYLDIAYNLMQAHGFRHLPVNENGRLLGMLSDRDVLLIASTDDDGFIVVPLVPVREAMSLHPITCREHSTITQVASVMLDRKIDSLVVLNSHAKVVGMITSSDLLELLLEETSTSCARTIPFSFHLRNVRDVATEPC